MNPGLDEDRLHAIFRSATAQRKGRGRPGDDAATLRPPRGRALVHSVDQVVEGVHVEAGSRPRVLAEKLLGRALSDLAAAAATPWAVAWTCALPAERGAAWARRLAHALLDAARGHGVPVIGGDVSAAPAVVLSCTAFGLEHPRGTPGRGGARPGDRLLVTGRLGNAVASGRHLRPQPRLCEAARLVERHAVHAMMDLSDGLARDLPRLLARSGVGAEVQLARLPLDPQLPPGREGWERAVGEGEDYELLVALSPRAARAARADRVLRRAGLTDVGACTERPGLRWRHESRGVRLRARGWAH